MSELVDVSSLGGPRPLTGDEAAVLACPQCAHPFTLIEDTAHAVCLQVACEGFGRLRVVTDLADAYADRFGDPNPAGWPRPTAPDGRPLPWLTPVIGGVVFWKLVHGGRLTTAQERWWCQVCGLPCDAEAVAVVDQLGEFVSNAPAHHRCAQISARICPRLAAAAVVLVTCTEDEITGVPYVRAPADGGPPPTPVREPVERLAAPSAGWRVPLALLYDGDAG